MRLFCSSRSPFARKVLVAAHEAGLADEIELFPVLAVTTQPDPELLKVSPLAKIPVLETPEGVLFDSHVICDWLNRQSGNLLLPPDGQQRTESLRNEALADGLAELLLAHRAEMRRPEACRQDRLLGAYADRMTDSLNWIEEAAGRLSSDPNLGNISLACVLSYMDFRFQELDWRKGRAQAAAWHEAFSRRPSMAATEYSDGQA